MSAVATASVVPQAKKKRTDLIDFDVHHVFAGTKHLLGTLPPQWRHYLETFDVHGPRPAHYNVMHRQAVRADSFPATGPAGSSLELMQEQLLDRYGITHAVLGTTLQLDAGSQPRDLGTAMTRAINDWTRQDWLDRDDRLLGAICVPFEHSKESVEEIRRWASDPRFVSVLFNGRTEHPIGNPKYWDIYEAAEARGLPIEVHVDGIGNNLLSGVGVPAFYIEGQAGHVQDQQSQLISLVFEGVFERFPGLQIVLVEGGFTWVGPMKWRMDRAWEILHDEVPRLKRRPSEYVESNFWFTTQPMEEPPHARQLATAIADAGIADRLLFATDYPHWDFDSPETAFPAAGFSDEIKEKIMTTNPRKLLRMQ